MQIITPWTRLIRFISKETGNIHLGEPLDPNIDGILLAFLRTVTPFLKIAF